MNLYILGALCFLGAVTSKPADEPAAPADSQPVNTVKFIPKASAALLEEQGHGAGNLSIAREVNRITEEHNNPEIELHVELVSPNHNIDDLENAPDDLKAELEILLSSIVENFSRSLKNAVAVSPPDSGPGSRSLSAEERVNNAIKEVLQKRMEYILRASFDIPNNPRLRDIANEVIDDIFNKKSRS